MAKIYYLLSEAGRKASLLSGGNGKEEQVIETPITPELLALATVDKDGNTTLKVAVSGYDVIGYKLERREDYSSYSPTIEPIRQRMYFDTLQTAEQLITWEQNRRAVITKEEKDLQPGLAEAVATWRDLRAKDNAKEEERKKLRDEQGIEREAKKAEAKIAYENDRKSWIEANGSEYLKTGLRLDYNINRTYLENRIAVEYPGFTLDNNDWNWKERTNPNPETLAEVAVLIEAGVNAEIVWIIESPGPVQVYGEGLVIHDYLGRYNLIKY